MPYGAKLDQIDVDRCLGVDSNGNSSSWTGGPIYSVAFSRNGTNRNSSLRNVDFQQRKGVPYYKEITLYKGPRLPYKIWNPKIGKYIWARRPIKVLKLITPRSRVSVTMGNLIVNDLDYFQVKSEGGPPVGSIRGFHPTYNRYITYSGVLVGRMKLMYGTNNYVASSMPQLGVLTPSSQYNLAATELDSVVLSKFYQKVADQNANLAASIAEYQQTKDMIASIFMKAIRGIRQLRRGNIADAARLLLPGNHRDIANSWLVYQYGLKPLMADIHALASAIAENKPVSYNVKVRIRKPVPRHLLYSHSHNLYMKATTEVYSEGYVDVTYGCTITVSGPVTSLVQQLGLNDPYSVAWELVPYSFVVDWFYPVGSFLEYHDAFNGLHVSNCYKTVFTQEKKTWVRTFGGTDSWGMQWPNQSYSYSETVTSCVRRKLSSVPPAPLPPMGTGLTKHRFLNALALLTQRL